MDFENGYEGEREDWESFLVISKKALEVIGAKIGRELQSQISSDIRELLKAMHKQYLEFTGSHAAEVEELWHRPTVSTSQAISKVSMDPIDQTRPERSHLFGSCC